MEDQGFQITKEGLKTLQKELKEREGTLKKQYAQTLDEMRSQGDLRENDGYSLAVDQFQENESRITELKEKIKNAIIVKIKPNGKINVGETVVLKNDKKEKKKYTLVSEDEVNPVEGKISYQSPLGSSILGKKKGQKVTIETPLGKSDWIIEGVI